MLEEKIMSDYKEAVKGKDSIRSSILSFLRSQFKYLAIEKRKDTLDDNEVISIIKKEIKKHQDSIEQFTKGNRMDLADKETKELAILNTYLPQQLSAEEVKKIVEDAVQATAAQGPKDMGKVMKEVISKVGQAADGKLVSDLVKERLSRAAGG